MVSDLAHLDGDSTGGAGSFFLGVLAFGGSRGWDPVVSSTPHPTAAVKASGGLQETGVLIAPSSLLAWSVFLHFEQPGLHQHGGIYA